jgi:hypothetical protein
MKGSAIIYMVKPQMRTATRPVQNWSILIAMNCQFPLLCVYIGQMISAHFAYFVVDETSATNPCLVTRLWRIRALKRAMTFSLFGELYLYLLSTFHTS